MKILINYHELHAKFFKNSADNAIEVRIMIIKNVDYNLNYISNPYANRKLDKADAVQYGTNTVSTFAGDLNKASNSSKVDTIELSQHSVKNCPTFPEVKDRIVSELNEDKDAEYLADLKAQINSNQYKINPLQIAKIMLLSNNE